MTRRLVVVGAGGFGREVLDVVDAINAQSATPEWNVVGFLDDQPSAQNLDRMKARGIPHLGGLADLDGLEPGVHYVVGVGSPRARAAIVSALDAAGFAAVSLVHPTATMGFDVRLGEGTVVCAGVRITTNVSVGRHVHLNLNATVGHDSVIGDFVSANPLVAVSGDCVVETGALLGSGSVVLNGLTVGAFAVVGGSACVVRSVPADAVVKGVPAR